MTPIRSPWRPLSALVVAAGLAAALWCTSAPAAAAPLPCEQPPLRVVDLHDQTRRGYDHSRLPPAARTVDLVAMTAVTAPAATATPVLAAARAAVVEPVEPSGDSVVPDAVGETGAGLPINGSDVDGIVITGLVLLVCGLILLIVGLLGQPFRP